MKKIFLCILCFFLCTSVSANVFFVENIPVSAEAESTVKAREKAVLEGQTTAFQQMLLTILLKEDYEKMPTLSVSEIADLVKDISVQNERTTATKYAASLSVRFDEEALKKIFNRHNIPYQTKTKTSFVVVPVFETPSKTSVFDEDSPLFQALSATLFPKDLYSFTIPSGDLKDMQTITPLMIKQGNFLPLESLRKRYNADEVLILTVQQESPIYNVTTQTYPLDESLGVHLDFAVSSASTDLLDINKKIIQKVLKKIKDNWRGQQNSSSQLKNMSVHIPIENLANWNQIRTQLEKMPFLNNMVVQALRKDKAIVEIFHYQTQENLIQSFKGHGYTLEQDATGDWTLTPKRNALTQPISKSDISAENKPVNLIGQSLQEQK